MTVDFDILIPRQIMTSPSGILLLEIGRLSSFDY